LAEICHCAGRSAEGWVLVFFICGPASAEQARACTVKAVGDLGLRRIGRLLAWFARDAASTVEIHNTASSGFDARECAARAGAWHGASFRFDTRTDLLCMIRSMRVAVDLDAGSARASSCGSDSGACGICLYFA
jgi:hypothetical protein